MEKTNNNRKIKMSKTRMIIFFTFITSTIVFSLSLSKFETMKGSQATGRVAKWNINLSTDYTSYTLFENNRANSQDYTVTVESESEVSSKYDLEIDGVYKTYRVRLARDGYIVSYSFSNNTLAIQYNNDEMSFDITNNNQTVQANENSYQMEKHTSVGKTYITITNTSTNKEILEFVISSNNEVNVIYKNCREFISSGQNEDEYSLRISTVASNLPKECNIKLYALFEQID